MKTCSRLINCALSATISLTTLMVPAISSAMESTPAEVSASQSNSEQLKAVEDEVRFIFEESSGWENGNLWIDQAKLDSKYGKEMGAYVAEGIRQLYTNDNLAEEIRGASHDRSFWSCMKGELVGLIPGVDVYQLLTSGDLKAYVEGKAWGRVAELLAPELVKLGAKSNVAGIVASIAVSTGKCVIFG